MSTNRAISSWLLYLSNGVFLLLYFFIAYYNRLAADDFHFLSNINAHGIWGGMLNEYATWSSRYSSVLLNHLFLSIESKTGYGLLMFSLVSLGLMVIGIKRIVVLAAERISSLKLPSPIMQWNLALLLSSWLFILTNDAGETWFWLCSACTYLWSVIALIYGAHWLLMRQADTINHVIGIVAFVYLGGSLAPLSLLVLLTMLIGLFFGNGSWSLPSKTRLSIGLMTLLIAFILLYLAEGNNQRAAFFEEIGMLKSIVLNVKMTAIILVRNIRYLIIMFLAFSILLFHKDGGPLQFRNRYLLTAYIVFPTIVFLYQWPITYKTQDIAALRAQFPIALILLLSSIYMFSPILLGENNRLRRLVLAGSTLIPLLFCGLYFWQQTQVLPVYAKAYDNRMANLRSQTQVISGVKYVQPLPTSGVLKTAEISSNPQQFINHHLKEGLNLSYMPVCLPHDRLSQ